MLHFLFNWREQTRNKSRWNRSNSLFVNPLYPVGLRYHPPLWGTGWVTGPWDYWQLTPEKTKFMRTRYVRYKKAPISWIRRRKSSTAIVFRICAAGYVRLVKSFLYSCLYHEVIITTVLLYNKQEGAGKSIKHQRWPSCNVTGSMMNCVMLYHIRIYHRWWDCENKLQILSQW